MTLSAGSTFAGYTVIRLLGAGGMGEVYLVQHPRLPRQDALKVLPESVSDSDYRERFLREADLAAGLWHPNIVRVNDRGEDAGQLWIAMDYIDGSDAGQLLQRYPAGMAAHDVAAIVSAVADALDYAHDHGLLHRDVKPANILITHPDSEGQRRVLLGDFGIARNADDISGLTATNTTVGTVAYAAPEQLMGDDIDGRADQYALAATAYHLLTGTTLYPGSNPVGVISRQLIEPPPRPSASRPGLAPFDTAFSTALAKEPSDRFSSCREFARALTAGAHNDGGYSPFAPTQQAPIPTAGKVMSKKPAPRSRAIVAIAVASVFGLAMGAVALWNSTATRQQTPSPNPTTTQSSMGATSPAAPSSTGTSTSAITSTPSLASTPPTSASTTQETPVNSAPSATPRAGDRCYQAEATTLDAAGQTMWCSPRGHRAIWVYDEPTMYTPPPAEIDPSGPRPGTPCSAPGAVVPGPGGLVDCQFRNWGPMGVGYFWGFAMR